jgi:hypothetical protein
VEYNRYPYKKSGYYVLEFSRVIATVEADEEDVDGHGFRSDTSRYTAC